MISTYSVILIVFFSWPQTFRKKYTGNMKQVNRKRKDQFYVCRGPVLRKRAINVFLVILWLNLYSSFLFTFNEHTLVIIFFVLLFSCVCVCVCVCACVCVCVCVCVVTPAYHSSDPPSPIFFRERGVNSLKVGGGIWKIKKGDGKYGSGASVFKR